MTSALLSGKIAVITGGNSGIGFAIAQRFIAEGAFVFITGRRQAELDVAVSKLGTANAFGIQGDVSKIVDLERLFNIVKEKKGRIDVLVPNAGVAELMPLEKITEAHYDKIFDINVKGTVFTVQKALPLIPDGGSIVLVGSIAGQKASPAFSVYQASKAALRSLARSFAVDLKARKIRVNVVSPGPISTPGLDGVAASAGDPELSKQFEAHLRAATVLGRVGEASEVASVAYFLASSESSYMTGADVQVDGGYAQT